MNARHRRAPDEGIVFANGTTVLRRRRRRRTRREYTFTIHLQYVFAIGLC